MKKLLGLFTALLLTLGLVGCGNDSTEPDPKPNPEPVSPVADSYYHEFKAGDLEKEGGSKEINGLTWNYGEATYIGFEATKGIQIGSSKNPVKEISFEANFPTEATITDFQIELSVGKGGNASYTVLFGDHTKTADFKNTTVASISEDNLEVKANSFKLTLKATAKAMYLKSIGFTAIHDGDWDLKTDGGSDDGEAIPGGSIKPGEGEVKATKFKLISIEDYYKGTDLKKTKDALKAELNTLVSKMTGVSYGDSRYMLQYTDEDIENPGKLNGLYDGTLFDPTWTQGHTWNREHVWACNRMQRNGFEERPNNSTIAHTSDLHNLRVCTNAVNSSRGNKGFDNVESSEYYFPNQKKGLDYRGDVARILFYMYVRYDGLNLGETVNDNTIGKLSVLIKWANEDKPDAFEKRRNNRIYEYQGNRNPFIDHPELVNQLFA